MIFRKQEWLLGIVSLLSLSIAFAHYRRAERLGEARPLSEEAIQRLNTDLNAAQSSAAFYQGLASSLWLGAEAVLEGTDQYGNSHRIAAAEVSAPMLLYSIDPDCPACIQTLPAIRSFAHSQSCVSTIGVAVDKLPQVPEFLESRDVDFPVLLEASGSLWTLLDLTTSPTVALIGPAGRLHWISRGTLSGPSAGRSLESEIDAVCEGVE